MNSPEGALEFVAIDDASALLEIAPEQPLVLRVLLHAYSQLAVLPEHSLTLRSKVNATLQSLVASFKGTDAVTLLLFLDSLLRTLDSAVGLIPSIDSEGKMLISPTDLAQRSAMAEARHGIHSLLGDKQAYCRRTGSIYQSYRLIAANLPSRDLEASLF